MPLINKFQLVADNIKAVQTDDTHVKIWLKTGEYFECYSMSKAVRDFIRYVPNDSHTDVNGVNYYIAL